MNAPAPDDSGPIHNVEPDSQTGVLTASPARIGRSMTIVGAIATGVGLVGFLVGIAEPVVPQRAPRSVPKVTPVSVVSAPAYRQMAAASIGPNRTWTSNFATLKPVRPGLFDPVVRTPAMKDAALRDRLRTRAFDGAPPVIPHGIEQQSAASCLVCHWEGLSFGDRIATRMSHPHFTGCTQCHVEGTGGSSWSATESAAPTNEFAGRLRSGPGFRAMPGAPPTIPHAMQLRDDCLSCHGLVARPGLRTTHPWLQNCVQCHVAAAEHAVDDRALSGPLTSTASSGAVTSPGDSLPLKSRP